MAATHSVNDYERLQEIGKGKYIVVSGYFPLGSYGSVFMVRRKSDGRMLVWKELDYRKLNEKER